ncbi:MULTISPECIES: hypothetical protein [Tenacibaculum]|uniref:hypothetical protein n=1 Tax=Tenacibaculum TaxID=104267 RepID=UPI0012E5F6B3|nr:MULTISPECIES: hypothetical protein [Tenacibaculum]MCO7186656.1 hypothetical protein [Tenacibaculum sp. XPcli2-G]GFE03593.1 hypothetical protein KUL156_61850 [Alteromonas sp. KUL156]
MMKIIPTLVIIFLCSVTSNVLAQMDGSVNGKKKGNSAFGVITAPVKEVKKPKALDFDNNNGFKTAHKEQQKELQKKQAQRDLENKGILTKAKIAEEQYLKSFKQINGMYQYPVIDQDLGSFSTKSKSVNIICRDYQYPDGDKVTIYINDVPVVSNLILRQRYQSFNIPLDKGINTIKIVALNQGTSGPNTAAFKIYNDAGMLISSNEWNLATGAKATIIVAKEQ